MRKSLILVGLLVLVALSGFAFATDQPASQGQMPALEKSNLVEITATVEKLNLKKRMITLKGPEGNTVTFKVDKSVKNLPQVKVGDQVLVRYYQSILVRVEKPGQAKEGVKQYATAATAEPGKKPAGVAINSITVNTTIEAIDKENNTVTLKGPKGKTQVVKVQDPKNLENVSVGDKVVITYTEALAVNVEKAK